MSPVSSNPTPNWGQIHCRLICLCSLQNFGFLLCRGPGLIQSDCILGPLLLQRLTLVVLVIRPVLLQLNGNICFKLVCCGNDG